MGLLTKVAKGIAYGDVSNFAVRNILTELSKSIGGGITEQEMEDTLDFFGWKCPYTGRDLRNSILNQDGTYATDHIYPQNREWCGLNLKGNLVIVDKTANSKKRDKDIKTFLEEDSDFWKKLGIPKNVRQDNLKEIERFQKLCGYDPHKIRTVIKPLLDARYHAVRKEQENSISVCMGALKAVGIHALVKPATSAPTPAKKRGATPVLEFYPADEKVFKDQLLLRKKAHFVLTYASGKQLTVTWNADRFTPDSDLKGNIQSKTFWRNKDKEGLVKVEVHLD